MLKRISGSGDARDRDALRTLEADNDPGRKINRQECTRKNENEKKERDKGTRSERRKRERQEIPCVLDQHDAGRVAEKKEEGGETFGSYGINKISRTKDTS